MGKDLSKYVGKKINKLEIISVAGYKEYKKWKCPLVNCLCDCGKTKIISLADVLNSHTKSCGCMQRKLTSDALKTHGMSKTRFYKTWGGMKYRCSANGSKRYTGRGITVSVEWEIFENFFNDMYKEYAEHIALFGAVNTTIDRINNDLGYYKENCRWSTCKSQARNTGRTLKIKEKSLAEISEDTGIPYHRLYQRLYRLGKNIETAIKMG